MPTNRKFIPKKLLFALRHSSHALLLIFLSFFAIDIEIKADEWAIPKVAEAHMRVVPSHSGELESQVVMGTPLKITAGRGEWYKVESPDGDSGWINQSSLIFLSDSAMSSWRGTPRVITTSLQPVEVWKDSVTASIHDRLMILTDGAILIDEASGFGNRQKVRLPDGRKGWIDKDDVMALDVWSRQPYDSEKILERATALKGTSYLWGGTTAKGVDCSGLVSVCFYHNGLIVPRNASQQARIGKLIAADALEDLEPGDLIFFGDGSNEKVTHVAIYERDGNFLHSSGEVRNNSFRPEAPNYLPRRVLFATSVKEALLKNEIKKVLAHPWFFKNEP